MQPAQHSILDIKEVTLQLQQYARKNNEAYDLSSIWWKKGSFAVFKEDVETPDSFIYSFIMSESDQRSQEKWSKHYIKMALTILGVPT